MEKENFTFKITKAMVGKCVATIFGDKVTRTRLSIGGKKNTLYSNLAVKQHAQVQIESFYNT